MINYYLFMFKNVEKTTTVALHGYIIKYYWWTLESYWSRTQLKLQQEAIAAVLITGVGIASRSASIYPQEIFILHSSCSWWVSYWWRHGGWPCVTPKALKRDVRQSWCSAWWPSLLTHLPRNKTDPATNNCCYHNPGEGGGGGILKRLKYNEHKCKRIDVSKNGDTSRCKRTFLLGWRGTRAQVNTGRCPSYPQFAFALLVRLLVIILISLYCRRRNQHVGQAFQRFVGRILPLAFLSPTLLPWSCSILC